MKQKTRIVGHWDPPRNSSIKGIDFPVAWCIGLDLLDFTGAVPVSVVSLTVRMKEHRYMIFQMATSSLKIHHHGPFLL